MNQPNKPIPLAGLLASGFTIVGAFVVSLFVVLAFSNSRTRDTVIVVVVFGAITMIPLRALRTPKDLELKKKRRWRWPWRRQRRKTARQHAMWKRKRGQTHHQPFGHRKARRPSTFVAAPRKPTEP